MFGGRIASTINSLNPVPTQPDSTIGHVGTRAITNRSSTTVTPFSAGLRAPTALPDSHSALSTR